MSAPVNPGAAVESLPKPELPQGLGYIFAFAVFNGLSSQVVLGSPLILYAKSLGASATILGLLAGMMPLLVIFQLPAAQYVPRVGYKRFMTGGWTARVLFIFLLAGVPLSGGFLDPPTRLALILACLFLFNLIRGISSCAWLPWVMELVPHTYRGRYLIGEQLCVNVAGAISFLLAAGALAHSSDEGRFAIIFFCSAMMGVASLRFLVRIPDAQVPVEDVRNRGPVPWAAIARLPPFRKVLRLNVAWAVAFGGLQTFIVAYLRSATGFSDGLILLAMAVYFAGGLASAWVAARRLDRLGSKPVLRFTMLVGALLVLGWWVQSSNLISPRLGVVVALLLLLGLTNALFNAAQNRLVMLTIPPIGRSHFLALFSVVLNVILGLSPVAWGLLIDAVGERHGVFLGIEWNRYSVFFGLAALCFAVAFVIAGQLEEKQAARVETLLHELLIHEPRKILNRYLLRG